MIGLKLWVYKETMFGLGLITDKGYLIIKTVCILMEREMSSIRDFDLRP